MSKLRLPAWLGKDGTAALIFLAPSAAGFILFYLIPFGMGIVYSFTDSTIGGVFVGFDNYSALLESKSFHKAAANTLLFTGVSVPLLIFLSLTLAILLNRRLYLRNWLQTSFVLPLVVPVASIVMIWQIFFDWNGTLNAWLNGLGLGRVDWMQSDGSMAVLAFLYIWKNIGYDMILFMAGLQAIPASYYETARIEGAGKLRQFYYITLVYLTPTMIFVVLISIINSFKVFREAYFLAGDYPYDRIYTLQHYMNNMFLSLDIQKLTAAASLMVVGILALVFALLGAERRFQSHME
ncbi:carbohydrate ABC transporter permease [Paenibacillus contaminans]|uniref:Sugar ABC transporter permease n=1 Tax=Paenibacillus contaminans TaxID=450362 RepID=A0A329MW22_9BACL|nr:sugar ABC transporter permease [Paenibacillus contaminans]RAV23046.1 sugar ABC transporter permease [Paenibacillus contaminans]